MGFLTHIYKIYLLCVNYILIYRLCIYIYKAVGLCFCFEMLSWKLPTFFSFFFFPAAGFCLGFESPKDACFVDKSTNERMRADYLPLCKGKALQLQGWCCSSQWCGHSPRVSYLLSYVQEAGHVTSCSSSGFCWKCSSITYCSSSLFAVRFVSPTLFSAASALSCLACHSGWSVALVLWKKEWVLQFTGWTPASQGWWILLYLYSHKATTHFVLECLRSQLFTTLRIGK